MLSEVVGDDELDVGDKKRPVVEDEGCWAACRIGRAYACALRVYVGCELDMMYAGDSLRWRRQIVNRLIH